MSDLIRATFVCSGSLWKEIKRAAAAADQSASRWLRQAAREKMEREADRAPS